MPLHQPRIGFSSLTVRRAAAALAVMVSIAGAADPVGTSQAPECETKIAAVTSATSGIPGSIGAAIGRGVENASALARFHRPDDALAKLDAIVALLAGPRLVPWVSATAIGFLALLGMLAARAGGAPLLPAAGRVALWGALALGVTAGAGALFGSVA